jgi:hypothetical protein
MKTCIAIATLLLSSTSAFAADAAITADQGSVNSACATEAKTASCTNEVVGTGLMKCIHNYKKANRKTFTISPGCKSAMEQLHADKKAGK